MNYIYAPTCRYSKRVYGSATTAQHVGRCLGLWYWTPYTGPGRCLVLWYWTPYIGPGRCLVLWYWTPYTGQLSTLQEKQRRDFCSKVSIKQRNLGRNDSTVTWRHAAWSMCSSFSEKRATAIILAGEHGDSTCLWNLSMYMTSLAKIK